MQASAWTLLCRLYTDLHAHVHTQHMQPIIYSWLKVLAMDATAVPHAYLFISLFLLGPTDNADPPTSPQLRPFSPKWEAENIHAVSHVLLSQFFSFHTMQSSLNSMNSSESMSSKAFWTPITASSHRPNKVHKVKVCPIKNEVRQTFFRFAKHTELGSRSKSLSN